MLSDTRNFARRTFKDWHSAQVMEWGPMSIPLVCCWIISFVLDGAIKHLLLPTPCNSENASNKLKSTVERVSRKQTVGTSGMTGQNSHAPKRPDREWIILGKWANEVKRHEGSIYFSHRKLYFTSPPFSRSIPGHQHFNSPCWDDESKVLREADVRHLGRHVRRRVSSVFRRRGQGVFATRRIPDDESGGVVYMGAKNSIRPAWSRTRERLSRRRP